MKITVITPALKYDRLLDLTIDSITDQNHNKTEHFIAHYKSIYKNTDIPSKLLNSNKIKVCQVRDSYYEAITTMINMAKGELICILNPGEILYDPDTFTRIANRFQKTNFNMIYGKKLLLKGNNNLDAINAMRISKKKKYQVRFTDVPLHTAIFFKKDLMQKTGMMSGELKFNSDYDLYRKMFKQECSMPYYMDNHAYQIKPNYINSTKTARLNLSY